MIYVSKLKPPGCKNALVRARLINLAEPGKSRPLTVISADAGYGKTTLMAQFYEVLGGIGIWYHLDSRDFDPVFFISHLTAAIKLKVPEFGQWVEERLRQVSDFNQEKDAVLTAFVNELAEKIETPVYFYFDDFHITGNQDIVSATVQFLLIHLPEGCRIFLAGRKKPDLPLARLRSQRATVEIGKEELRFTLDETVNLLRATEKPVSQKQIRQLYERTEGWPAALVLSQTLIEQKGVNAAIKHLAGDVATDYLTNEIWAGVDPEYKRFFMECSLLDPVEADLCDRIINVGVPCAGLFRLAENRNLMIVSLGENLFRFHPMLRDFLQRKLHEELGPERINELHIAFGDAYAESGDYEFALQQLFAAKEYDRVTGIVEACGLEMLNAGRSQTVNAWLQEIPQQFFDQRPWLYYFRSQIDERRGSLNQALIDLSLAEKGFTKTADKKGMLYTYLARGEILANQTNNESSLKAYMEALRWAGSRDEKIDAHNRVGVQSVMCGNTKKSLEHFAHALDICDETMLEKKMSISIYMLNPLFFTGDFTRIILNTENIFGSALDSKPILDRFTVFFYRVLALFEMGLYQESLRVLDDADIHFGGEKLGFEMAFDCLRGQNLLFGKKPAAGRNTIKSLFSSEAEHKLLGPDCALIHLGAIERCKGNLDAAMQIHETAITACYADGKPYSIANALQHAGADRIRMGDAEQKKGLAQLDEAFAIALDGGYEYVKSQVYFHKAWLASRNSDIISALSMVKSCLEITARFRHDHFMIQEGAANIELLALAFGHNIERGYLTGIFQQIGPASLAGLNVLLESQDVEIRLATIQVFSAIGGAEAVSYVRKMTKDKNQGVREAAQTAVEKMRLAGGNPRELLTSREMQVLECISQGLGNLDIAQRLFISESTVKTHVTRIFNKLGFNKRSQVVAYYHRKYKTVEPAPETPNDGK